MCCIKYNSIKYYYYVLCSKIVVDNYCGIVYTFSNNKSKFFEFIVNDKRQLNISTWHGTPLKRIGKAEKGYENKILYTSTDLMTVNSKYVADIMENSFGFNNIKSLGFPRNDILFKNDVTAIKKKLQLPINKNVVLFAPTFRENLYESGERQLNELNITKLLDTLHEKFGGEWVFVARVHNEVLRKFNFSQIADSNIINGNLHDDMAEYLVAADVLITDYSASMYDYLYTNKPCFLLALDKENYEKRERGFYMDINDLPFSIATNVSDFYTDIKEFDKNKYQKNVKKFLEKIGSTEDGNSSNKIAKIIRNYYYDKNAKTDVDDYYE